MLRGKYLHLCYIETKQLYSKYLFYTGLRSEHESYKNANPTASDVPTCDDVDSNLPEKDQTILRTLGIQKGKCPEAVKGIYH